MKLSILKLGLICLTLFCAKNLEAQKTAISSENELYAGIEFEMPKVKTTKFPNYTANIKDFGAITGGLVKNTEAFEKAIKGFFAGKTVRTR